MGSLRTSGFPILQRSPVRFNQDKTIRGAAKATGVPTGIIRQVYERGGGRLGRGS